MVSGMASEQQLPKPNRGVSTQAYDNDDEQRYNIIIILRQYERACLLWVKELVGHLTWQRDSHQAFIWLFYTTEHDPKPCETRQPQLWVVLSKDMSKVIAVWSIQGHCTIHELRWWVWLSVTVRVPSERGRSGSSTCNLLRVNNQTEMLVGNIAGIRGK